VFLQLQLVQRNKNDQTRTAPSLISSKLSEGSSPLRSILARSRLLRITNAVEMPASMTQLKPKRKAEFFELALTASILTLQV
jgi:hypothetical protein